MRVALFVTCLADHYFAGAAADAVRLLRHLGCTVDFPEAQSCCGQPAWNAGQNREAMQMAEHTARVFARADAVVVPSGSCAAMLKKSYPKLDARGNQPTTAPTGPARKASQSPRPDPATRASPSPLCTLAARTWELGEFIVHRLGVTELGNGLAGRRVAIHQGCHALRELRLETESEVLLRGAGAEIVPWEAQSECCGFGGLFAIKMGAVSAAMADRKIDTLPVADWVVSGDGGCILHLDGRARMRRAQIRFVHLATALWEGTNGRPKTDGSPRTGVGSARRAADGGEPDRTPARTPHGKTGD